MRTSVLAALVLSALPIPAQTFSKDIAPIFARQCLGCHASAVKMGSLDLDTEEGIRRGGNHGTVLVPGKSDSSRLYLMIAGKATPAMPMSGQTLPAQDIEAIRRWIDAGARFDGPVTVSAVAVPVAPKLTPRRAVKAQVGAMAWRPDGRTLALGLYREVRLTDPAGKTMGTLAGHAEQLRAVAFSPDGRLLAAAGGQPARKGEVKIWDVDARTEVRVLTGHSDCIYGVAFSRDGRILATASYDKLIKLWDISTGNEVRTLKDHIDAIYALAFTPDGKQLVSASADRGVKVWDPETGERLYTMSEPLDGLNTLAVHPSGRFVAAGGLDKTIRIWEIGPKSARLVNSQIAHEDAILHLAFSPDGKTLASSSADKTIKFLKTEDLSEIKVLANQPDWVTTVEFAPDGRAVAVGRFDGSIEFIEGSRLSSGQVAAVRVR
ncbi:MAG: WD40 repeat domain-containing protein [Bryobacteraceae bacterium]